MNPRNTLLSLFIFMHKSKKRTNKLRILFLFSSGHVEACHVHSLHFGETLTFRIIFSVFIPSCPFLISLKSFFLPHKENYSGCNSISAILFAPLVSINRSGSKDLILNKLVLFVSQGTYKKTFLTNIIRKLSVTLYSCRKEIIRKHF